MADLGPKFYKRLLEISRELSIPPEFLLTVMNMESGLNPHIGGKALGLVQILPKYLKNVGWQGSADEFVNQPAYKQLEYVKNLIKSNMKFNGGPFKSVTQYYVSNFLPLALKLPGVQAEDPNTPIVRKNPEIVDLPWRNTTRHIVQERLFYNSNSGLDEDKDGVITYGDLQRMMAKKSAKNNSTYRKALEDLRKYTGYSGSEEFESPLETVEEPKSFPKKSPRQLDVPFTTSLENLLSDLLKKVRAEDRYNKRLYKKALKENKFVIEIYAQDEVDAIEFANILCTSLDETLLAKAFTHTDGFLVEIEGKIHGPEAECQKAVEGIAKTTANAFFTATKKLGGIKVGTKVNFNKTSSLKYINIITAETNHRKFLLKIT